MSHETYENAMRRALELALLGPAWGVNPQVGCVILDAYGQIIAEGWHKGAGTPHAEVDALSKLASVPAGATAVVTLEPCTMCAGAAVLARVDRIVFGAHDEKAGAAGSMWDLVRDRRLNHRPEVVSGVLAEESASLLREFFGR